MEIEISYICRCNFSPEKEVEKKKKEGLFQIFVIPNHISRKDE